MQSVSVLIVDDSDSARLLMASILKKAGYQVDQASNGTDALEMADRQKYGAVITDLNMPNMGGSDLVSKLRTLSGYRFTPILITSGESLDSVKVIKGREGATGWVLKPVRPVKLLASLRRLL